MTNVLDIAAAHAARYLEAVQTRPIATTATVDELRARLQHERSAFIHERMETMKHLSTQDRQQMERLMGELLEKLLLEPAERLRGEKELRRKIQNVEALRDLFLSNREKQ